MKLLRDFINDDEAYEDIVVDRTKNVIFICFCIIILFMVVGAIASVVYGPYLFWPSVLIGFKISALLSIGIFVVALVWNVGVAKEWFDE